MDWQSLLQGSMASLVPHLTLEKVLVSRDGTKLLICFLADKLVEEQEFLRLRDLLQNAFRGFKVSLRVCSPALADDVRRDITPYLPFLADCLSRQSPGVKPWLRNAEWRFEEDRLIVSLPSEEALRYTRVKELDRRLAAIMDDVFRMKLEPVFICSVDIEAQKARVAALEERAKQAVQQQAQQLARETQEKKKPEGPQRIMGFAIKDEILPISGLKEDSGRVAICGAVVSMDTRELRGGEMRLLTFALTDYTSTINCKSILRYRRKRPGSDTGDAPPSAPTPEEIERVNNICAAVKPGAWLTVRGDCQYDKFSRDIVVMLNDIETAKAPPERQDTAEEKRVELHLHTQMSSMDGISSASDLIAQAAKWGHPAVAVTDHGVVQAFPEAFAAAKKNNIKLIPGCEGYLIDDADIVLNPDDRGLKGDIIVVDFETTGLSAKRDRIIEIGAVRLRDGQVQDDLSLMVDPGIPLPEKITELTGITNQMVHGQPSFAALAPQLLNFIGDGVFAAHNAAFDHGFLREELKRCGLEWHGPVLDTLAFARRAYPKLKSFKLGALCKHLGVSLKNAHRAVHDAKATALCLARMLTLAQERGITKLNELNSGFSEGAIGESHHIILLATCQDGITNLNRLVSAGHLEYFARRPHMPRKLIQKYRSGLILGSACEAGELFRAVLDGKDETTLSRIARFYDYLEIQPIGNNEFLVREGRVKDDEELRELNRKIVRLGEKCGIPVVATGDVHFLHPRDAQARAILQAGQGFSDADNQAPLYFKTTDEMLEEFSYLGEAKAREVVIENPRKIADKVGEVRLFPKHPEGKETFQPFWADAADDIQSRSWGEAKKRYGEELPEIVSARLDKELGSIIGYGFATLYSIAQKLVSKSNADGYLVGSRGSVGSSFVATMCGITEVNPLPPHYRCPNPDCKWSYFDVKHELATCGVDLPPKTCPVCGTECLREGFDIPFEVFLGFKGDKVPDIDLNFSGVYRPTAAKYVETLFGAGNVFRAGTIGTMADKTAYGYVKKYMEERGRQVPEAEMNRLALMCVGVKRTTGQHPGGIVVLPRQYEIYQFTAIQHPADDPDSSVVTTHYDFGSMHDVLVKLDLLGHDDPTMINMLERLTGENAKLLPLNDPGVMSLFSSPKALGVTEEQIRCTTGTYGIPEFGTRFVRGMLDETHPSTMDELVRISGLSHGTDVWLGNAADLIEAGVAKLKDCICCRDDIMNSLIMQGVEKKMAFTTMESVRKGRGLKPEMEQAMRDANTPEWFIDSCKKIKYMFPKGHAVAYVTMALRVAWFKLYRPTAYYAAYYTVRADAFDINLMSKTPDELRDVLDDLDSRQKSLSAAEKDQITLGEIALEMACRGIKLLPIDLYKSEAQDFQVVGNDILPPFNAIPGLGLNAALSIVEARKNGPEFLSVEDLCARAKISSGVVEMLRAQGALDSLPETSQVSFF